MRGLHFDCFSGISGDMTLAALLDLGVAPETVCAALDSLGLPIQLAIEKVRKGGLAATHVRIAAPEEDTHRHLPEIEDILGRGALTSPARELARRIFRRLAEAEAEVHGIAVEKVHFHEVGALDSIADIVGVAVALDSLGIERFTCRSVVTGTGTVKCAHGLMPVPAPATALLLRGAPLAGVAIRGELTTPTGAAILAAVVHEWNDAPAMTIEKIGLGAGTRELLEQPNVLRLFLGTVSSPARRGESDCVWMVETNLDDLPAEVIGYTSERLFAAGALDVYAVPIQMKKNRPGVLLAAICPEENLAALERVLFEETATFGVRRYPVQRSKLQREAVTVQTPLGPILGKRGWRDGLSVFAPEYEDCARVARERGLPLREVYELARRAFRERDNGVGGF